MLGLPLKILEIDFSARNNPDDPTFRFCQLKVSCPDGSFSRYEVGTIEGKTYFEILDENYEEPDWSIEDED